MAQADGTGNLLPPRHNRREARDIRSGALPRRCVLGSVHPGLEEGDADVADVVEAQVPADQLGRADALPGLQEQGVSGGVWPG